MALSTAVLRLEIAVGCPIGYSSHDMEPPALTSSVHIQCSPIHDAVLEPQFVWPAGLPNAYDLEELRPLVKLCACSSWPVAAGDGTGSQVPRNREVKRVSQRIRNAVSDLWISDVDVLCGAVWGPIGKSINGSIIYTYHLACHPRFKSLHFFDQTSTSKPTKLSTDPISQPQKQR